jgi:peroxiredoxin family protein
VSIIISKGSLEATYPELNLANGARAVALEANLFFTFFWLDALRRKRIEHIKVATVGNPAMHIPTLVGGLPGVSALATHMMTKQMEELDIPPIDEFIEMIGDIGAGMYACNASVDMFGLGEDDFVKQIHGIITVGDFYTLAADGQIIFTEAEASRGAIWNNVDDSRLNCLDGGPQAQPGSHVSASHPSNVARIVAVSGWSGNTASRPSTAARIKSTASTRSPRSRKDHAKLFIDVNVSGWRSPNSSP